MVGFPKDVEDIIYDKDKGILNYMKEGAYFVDHTTSSPGLAQKIASDLKKLKNVNCMDAPVSGGEAGAKAGKLVTMIGGDGEAIDHCMPLLNCYSR